MKPNHKYLLSTVFTIILVGLSACNNTTPNVDNDSTANNQTPSNTITPEATPTESPTPTPTDTPTPVPTQAKLNTKQENTKANSKPASKDAKVVLYTIDAECQEFVPEESTVPANEPVNEAVGKILAKNENGDFSISGYRVNVKNGVATVDLRVSPASKRQIASLSSCENNAIFGSLRKTLTANSQWNIKNVRFTEKGEEILF